MATATGFWSGRQGLGRHFWLYFILPVIALTGISNGLAISDLEALSNPNIHAALYAAASVAAMMAVGPLFISIIRSNNGLTWKILVAFVTTLMISTLIRLAYANISQL